jgi:hypothetical protein
MRFIFLFAFVVIMGGSTLLPSQRPRDEASAISFNGFAPLDLHASNELCNAIHGPWGTDDNHNTCADIVTNGTAGVPRRTRFEFDDGSVLASGPATISYASGLVVAGAPIDEVPIGDYSADVDILCDGALDQFETTALILETTIPAHISAQLPPASSFLLQSHSDVTLPSIALLDAVVYTTPLPFRVNAVNLKPLWAGVAPETYGAVTFLDTAEPGPPIAPFWLCTQSPRRSTVNFPGSFGFGSPFTNPANMAVVIWDLTPSQPDYFDGLTQVGPTGGTHEATGTSVPSGVLRNVTCINVGIPVGADGSLTEPCPANNGTEGVALTCHDGGLWEDTDNDGLPDIVELRWGSDCSDPDSDNDGFTDFEDMAALTNPKSSDTDGDSGGSGTRTDAVDNCPLVANALQEDFDGDDYGDACDQDDDGDGLLDTVETAGMYMAFVNSLLGGTLTVRGPGFQCRNFSEIAGGGVYGLTVSSASSLKIVTDPLDADTDNDGIVDGAECAAGSAPATDVEPPVLDGVCIGTWDGVGAACGPGVIDGGKWEGDAVGTKEVIATSGAASRPELEDSAVADQDGDGLFNETDDLDLDGLDKDLEMALRTRCARVTTTSAYAKPILSECSDAVYPGVFNNDMDDDALFGDPDEADANSDCNAAWAAPSTCTGVQVCAWSAASGYTADTFATTATGGAGCDGPEFFAGGSPSSPNEDGDGLAVMKSTASSGVNPYGANLITAYGAAGLGGCSWGEEALHALSDGSARDFRDVNRDGIINAVDTGLVRGAFNATAGLSPAYKRTLDLNPASSAGGRGNGIVNAVDNGLVRAQFNKSCTGTP